MSKRSYQSGQVRIIAGKWRGRLITFPSNDLIRPTSDRLKETLFNWIQPYLRGASCLDLFAGSGALGFESLSRGALHCDFVDSDSKTCQHLEQTALTLQTQSHVDVIQASAPMVPKILGKSYQILFVDPPFDADIIVVIANWLHQHHMVAKGGLVYVERSLNNQTISDKLPWEQIKSKHAGNVSIELYQHLK